MQTPFDNLDLSVDQPICSIYKDGEWFGDVEIFEGKILTGGGLGESMYENFVALLYGLQGFGIGFDDIFFY